MVFRVTIRDVKKWDRWMREGAEMDIPDEVKHNSRVFRELVKYSAPIFPKIKDLSQEELELLTNSAAYLLRTDLVMRPAEYLFGMYPAPTKRVLKIHREDGIIAHLRNDPSEITEGWKLPYEDEGMSAPELFRCFSAPVGESEILRNKLTDREGCFGVGGKLTDVTHFLLTPSDLIDYSYTDEETDDFNSTIARQAEEI